jgi:hypothetical protein
MHGWTLWYTAGDESLIEASACEAAISITTEVLEAGRVDTPVALKENG